MGSCIRLAGIAARARHFITIIQKHTEYILMLNAWAYVIVGKDT
jgi:hypothetical protein